MLRIAICEDERIQSEYLQKLILEWQDAAGWSVSLRIFDSAEQFLFHTEESGEYDLLLLDIQMGKMNGMELAHKVRLQDPKVRIVFLTGVRDYAIEGYEVGAIRYILKPVKETEFYALLSKVAEELVKDSEEYFVFQSAGRTKRIPFRDILYVEADKHYVVLTAYEKEREKGLVTSWKWKAIFSSLSEQLEAHDFFLLRRGLYVNLDKVEQIGKQECFLENGEVLPVSKSMYQQFNQRFIAFYKGKIG